MNKLEKLIDARACLLRASLLLEEDFFVDQLDDFSSEILRKINKLIKLEVGATEVKE